VHSLPTQRLLKGQFHKLYENLRMSISSFDELLKLVGLL
jgi:hypothetical protein